jgi:hypothetical protein
MNENIKLELKYICMDVIKTAKLPITTFTENKNINSYININNKHFHLYTDKLCSDCISCDIQSINQFAIDRLDINDLFTICYKCVCKLYIK